ncbi:ArsR/SmtB family transcription factor [Paenibacillus protaetiae]|uniref:ArsR family transcriptional regulator n=1 Tax=Paenibacillus protaetiae TaxID=2509456 RepID=A0A4P6EZW2_9BACL|nr:winged helix-turn-helix domain-containing protein [Paenibacillus protaetiae]QAY67359.1 ArsR family transcriptional regulator [Paenibacillus protaetiae]
MSEAEELDFKQQAVMVMESFEQLKAVSDPFRSKLLTLLIEQSYTGQQLARLLEVPRSKVHYALTELENTGFIRVARKEELGGIVQKFYKAVAYSFRPGEHLIPQSESIENYNRNMMLNTLSRAATRAMTAPEEAFINRAEVQHQPRLTMQLEARVSEDTFIRWLMKYRELLKELEDMEEEPDGRFYYMSSVAFEIDEPYFEENRKLGGADHSKR